MPPPNCPKCPKCQKDYRDGSNVIRHGVYYRTSDSQEVQRYFCINCKSTFSEATFHFCYRQKKRHKNEDLRKLLSSAVSLRRSAKILCLTRVTVARKFILLALKSEYLFQVRNREKPKAQIVEFDDLETFEHTKCKPLSVTLAVEHKSRRILGIEVSEMPAKGLLVHKAKKYGKRQDLRKTGRQNLFQQLRKLVVEDVVIKSDSNPHYPSDVKRFFPQAKHVTYEGKRGALTGQGELKKVVFDPLFSLNHTCAMLRANVSRLIRKTWCTTKSAAHLQAHLTIYANFHNENLRS